MAFGFYVYQGRSKRVRGHLRVARHTIRFGDGSPERPFAVCAPAVYVLPVSGIRGNPAGYYRKRVEFRDGDFWLTDGRNLREIARPPRLASRAADPPPAKDEVEWLN